MTSGAVTGRGLEGVLDEVRGVSQGLTLQEVHWFKTVDADGEPMFGSSWRVWITPNVGAVEELLIEGDECEPLMVVLGRVLTRLRSK